MTKIQKVFCVFLSICFLCVLAVMREPFSLCENFYRVFPLYCFLEAQEEKRQGRMDQETSEAIIAANGAYLSAKTEMQAEKQQEEKQQSGAKKKKALKEQAAKEQEQKLTEEIKKEQEDVKAQKDVEEKKAGEEQVATTAEDPQVTEQPLPLGEEETTAAATGKDVLQPHPEIDLSPESLADFQYVLNHFFIVDQATEAREEQINAAAFLEKDLTLQQDNSVPQILIYHSHSQETFADSREGVEEDTIVGVGDYLTTLLTETYGYNVLHVRETFDIVDGAEDRNRAYDFSREYVEQVLKDNPSIEVTIDLHRDGVDEDRHLVTEINGKQTAQIMFYNGLSYTRNNGPVEYLPNPYIQDNLAFSFQMEYLAAQYYPDFYRGIYLAGLRYNLHMRPRAMLLEAGAQTNTVQEVKNAMEPFAELLHRVLSGEKNAQ